MTDADAEDKPGTIPTNLRLLLALEEVARAGVPVTPTEVNERLGLPKPTIHRLFATLEAEGFVQREIDGRSYSVGRRLRRLSVNAMSSLRVRKARLAVMNALAAKIGETCNVSIPDRDAMIYLDRVETKWPLRIQLPIGTHVPFHCSASGKMYHLDRFLGSARLERLTPRTIVDPEALRAEIEATRRRGYSQDDEEYMEGMIALAAPVLDDQGRLLATLSFHAPTMRITLDEAKAHLGDLRHAAGELSRLVA